MLMDHITLSQDRPIKLSIIIIKYPVRQMQSLGPIIRSKEDGTKLSEAEISYQEMLMG